MIRKATLIEKHAALAYDLRQRINPLYADQRGTESYERRECAEAIESLLAERAMLLKLLEDATDDAEYYCQYAGEYLVDKHGIKDRIAEYRAAIAQIEGTQP